MPRKVNLITPAQASAFDPVAAGASAQTVSLLIAVASQAIRNAARRAIFGAERVTDERYDGAMGRVLSLRRYPIIQLNSLTISPDLTPTVLTSSSFNVRAMEGRIAVKPGVTGVWGGGGFGFGDFVYSGGTDNVGVDYVAGYGWQTTLTGAVTAGTKVTLPVTAQSGYVPEQGSWEIEDSCQVVIDSGTVTEEVVDISISGGQVIAATLANNHAAGATVGGALPEPNVQFACAKVISNMLAMPDLTRKMEGLGRIGGYESQIRALATSVYISPEIKEALEIYRKVPI